MTYADRIRAILDLPGWNQKRIGDEIGVSQATVSRWQKGGDVKSTNEKRLTDLERQLFGDAPSEPAAYDSILLEKLLAAAFKAIGIHGSDAHALSLRVLDLAREGHSEGDPVEILNRLLVEVLIKRPSNIGTKANPMGMEVPNSVPDG